MAAITDGEAIMINEGKPSTGRRGPRPINPSILVGSTIAPFGTGPNARESILLGIKIDGLRIDRTRDRDTGLCKQERSIP